MSDKGIKIDKINVPSAMPRILSALQFGAVASVFFCVIFAIIGILFKMPFFLDVKIMAMTFLIGTACISPTFYISNKRLGLDELKKGMYTATEATLLEINDNGVLLQVNDKKVAVAKPLIFNISYEQLSTKGQKITYIKTFKGHEFLTII